VRPPRELAFALAMFLYSLEPGDALPRDAAASKDAKALAQGQALFERHCTTCHSNPALGGPPVPAERVGTDRTFANGGARGTGTYRTPALIRVAAAAPYFHDGTVPTLADVLSPERLAPSYTRSPVSKGAVPGHTFGTDLPIQERAALVLFMQSL
jgi:cytochrome c peroxidase